MATINLNVKIKVGPRTSTTVEVYSTSTNGKAVKLKNGKTLTDQMVADWIAENLPAALKKFEEITDVLLSV